MMTTSEPTIDAAREWAAKYTEQSIASFACWYPGKYQAAAKLARQARKELENEH